MISQSLCFAFLFCFSGIIFGFVSNIGYLIETIFCHRIWAKIPIDFIVWCIFGFAFYFTAFTFSNGEMLPYFVIAYTIGIAVEKTTIGFLWTNRIDMLYNVGKVEAKKLIKSKLGQKILK